METLLEDDRPEKPSESQTPSAMSGSVDPTPAAKTLEGNDGVEAKTPADLVTGDGGLELAPGGSPAKSPFAVGDFVWGKKAKNHPWWPGLVCDPASRGKDTFQGDHAAAVPVSWFGDGGSCTWCEQSLLKPFVPEFRVMVKQSGTKGLVRAVEDALDEVRRCLELELSCHCVPPEARAKSFKDRVQIRPIENFQCLEFLRRLHDVACNSAKASLLEIAMLKSWVIAFGKGWANGAPGYHIRRGISELVDKIDLDVSPGYLGDCNGDVEEEEEQEVGRIKVGTKKEKKRSEDRLFKSKRKSMIKLLSEMDLDTVELSEDEEPNVGKRGLQKHKVKSDNAKVSETESGSVNVDENSGSGRRERKKSKYLSPPYTTSADGIKSLASPKSVDNKLAKENSKGSQTINSESPAILKRSNKSVQKEEDRMSPLPNIESLCVHDLLSELLYVAIDPFHLKGNQSAKAVRAFFGLHRSSMHSSGSGFLEYQNHFCESSGKNLKDVNGVMAVSSGVGVAEQKAGNHDSGAGTEILGGSNTDSRSPAETSKLGRKRKMKREASIGSAAKVVHQIVNIPVESIFEQNLNTEPINCQQPVESKHELTKGKMVNNGQNVALLGHCIAKKSQEGKSAKKKMKVADKVPSSMSLSVNSKNTSGLEQKFMEKQDDGCDSRYPAALLLTFSSGATLPSKDELISAFSKYGVIIEPETELMKEKSSARVVFAKSMDAEKAFNSSDKTGIFKSDTSYRLRYLPPITSSSSPARSFPKPPLPYIRENLERMISTLTSSSSPLKDSGSLGALKSDARENLVGDMEGLLKKVNMMLNGPAAGANS